MADLVPLRNAKEHKKGGFPHARITGASSIQDYLRKKQAVSLARRMAGKKGAVVQLQAEINTEEDWDKLLTKDGVIVVDVYSDWCGPCVGMVGNLKKCKLELGGDMLQLAIAKADDIEVLKRFRNKSEPTWMFITGGKLVNLMFGANAPKLMQLIEAELKYEQSVLKGELERKGTPFEELTPIEKERMAAAEKLRLEEERAEAARQLALRNEERNRRFGLLQEHLITETVVVVLPHVPIPEIMAQLDALWPQIGLMVLEVVKKDITEDSWEELFYRAGKGLSQEMATCLSLGPCTGILLRCIAVVPPGVIVPEEINDIEKLVCETVCQVSPSHEQEFIVPHPDSLSAQYEYQPASTDPEGGGDEEECEGDSDEEPVEKKPDTQQKKVDNKKTDGQKKGQVPKKKPETPKKLGKKRKKASVSKIELPEEGEGGEEETEVQQEKEQIFGIYTPATAMSKCAAFVQFFPQKAEKLEDPRLRPRPPRLLILFETSKADECFTAAHDLAEEILGIGFFDRSDPDGAVLLAKTPKQYAKLAHNVDNRLVVGVNKRHSETMLNLAALNPLYISPDETVGAVEVDKFFPPGLELDPEFDTENGSQSDQEIDSPEALDIEDHESDYTEDEEDSGDDQCRGSDLTDGAPAGGLTPVTAVTDT